MRTVSWRFGRWVTSAGLAVVLVAVLSLSAFGPDPFAQERADAAAAITSLNDGDLAAVDQHLAANVGNLDFAYFFTSGVTPRSLGDALATVAGAKDGTPIAADVDVDAYESALTDLAGAVSLATHGTGDRALPPSWTGTFIEATTSPEKMAIKADAASNESPKQRADQDVANKQNLLLLLSRGYWSTDFLQAVTDAYWDLDHRKGATAWPGSALKDAKYAPAPNGIYLTDGVLALTAALTANPTASKWAFTEFQPGTTQLDGSDYTVGNFTHYLLFGHQFPESSDGGSTGITATLTALSSASDSVRDRATRTTSSASESSDTAGPLHDLSVLRTLAQGVNGGGCSWNPHDYWNCAKAAWGAVSRWFQHWGHVVLDILSLATFAPPPFVVVGVAAATTNATWYAIDGDYAAAGLSLAAAIPGLAFAKIAKDAKAGVAIEKSAGAASEIENAAAKSAAVAERSGAWRPKPWNDCSAVGPGGLSIHYGKDWTPEQRQAAVEKVKAYYEAAKQGNLRKAQPERSSFSAADRYKRAGLPVPDGADVDHTIDLQLGGIDDVSNMKPLDPTVNRSLGKQVDLQIASLPVGQLISSAAICSA